MSSPLANLEKILVMADDEIDRTARAVEQAYIPAPSNPAHFCHLLDQNELAVQRRNKIEAFIDGVKMKKYREDRSELLQRTDTL